MVKAGRDVWVPPAQHQPQQGHHKQGARHHVQAAAGDLPSAVLSTAFPYSDRHFCPPKIGLEYPLHKAEKEIG